MRYLKITLFSCIAFVFQACPVKLENDGLDLVGALVLTNKCGEIIYYDCYEVSSKEINSSNLYYDQLIKLDNNNSLQQCKYYAQQFEGNYNKKIWILIYKQSTLDTHSWEEIQTENLYDKRYSFTLEELKAMNWTIVYDGE
jgi:S-adenosylmethionine/arginine decarboxylase-like enzyme